MDLSTEDRLVVVSYLEKRFNIQELKNLCFDVGISHENFLHDTKPTFARELILYCERAQQINCLLKIANKKRRDKVITSIIKKIEDCQSLTKIEIVFPSESLNITPEDLRIALCELFVGVSPNQIEIIAIASGSIHILVSIPSAVIRLNMSIMKKEKNFLMIKDVEERVFIRLFDDLTPSYQGVWRFISNSNIDNRSATEILNLVKESYKLRKNNMIKTIIIFLINLVVSGALYYFLRSESHVIVLIITITLIGGRLFINYLLEDFKIRIIKKDNTLE